MQGHVLWTILLIVILYIKRVQTFILPDSKTYRPVVLWHGMGDDCCNPESMGHIVDLIEQTLPGIYVYSIMIGSTPSEDKNRGFFDNINTQIDFVCQTLKENELLQNGFNAIGFSQGGQFLRAYVERCNDPPIHNLITLGSPHNGVADLPGCADTFDFKCRMMRSIASHGVYTNWVQSKLVQAQYYKDPHQWDIYLEKCIFLPDINNEKELKNSVYKDNLIQLNKLVMVMFKNDTMIYPKETAWFGWINEVGQSIPMRDQPIYSEDWIGLKTLDNFNKLVFLAVEGDHLRMTMEYFKHDIIEKYLSDDITKWGNISPQFQSLYEPILKKLTISMK